MTGFRVLSLLALAFVVVAAGCGTASKAAHRLTVEYHSLPSSGCSGQQVLDLLRNAGLAVRVDIHELDPKGPVLAVIGPSTGRLQTALAVVVLRSPKLTAQFAAGTPLGRVGSAPKWKAVRHGNVVVAYATAVPPSMLDGWSTAIASLGACGGGTDRQRKVDGLPIFTSCDVTRAFRKVTGGELTYRHRVDFGRFDLGVSDDLSISHGHRSPYGEFDFDVQLEPPTLPGYPFRPASGRPDSRGIYWKYDAPERVADRGAWVALKIRRNVKLSWWSPTKATDHRWETLNRVLLGVRHSNVPCS